MNILQKNYSAIFVPMNELDLDAVLVSGQTFRWRKDDEGWWISPLGGNGIVLRIIRRGETLLAEALGGPADVLVNIYFHLDILLRELSAEWAIYGESHLSAAMLDAPGLRLVRQDPVECLFSFLCSSAAPIHRIRKSVEGMSRLLGKDLGVWHGVQLNAFPAIKDLASVPRTDLNRIGLGFRGKYIIETAKEIVHRGGCSWLESLRFASYEDAKAALVSLPGVGEKVADCVCLFSLDKHQAVPVDVHMARVAQRLFEECRGEKSLSPKMYAIAASAFRQKYGMAAGWAQQYLFFAEIERKGLWDQELGKHRKRLPDPK
jgi:N-glycosylase/DNA lyase